jgi:aminopeptidase N
MEFFEKEIGVPYPWAKYDQVCIQDYHWGGMENTTLTTLNINTLFPTNYENVRTSQGLVAHETGAPMVRRSRHVQGLEPHLAE